MHTTSARYIDGKFRHELTAGKHTFFGDAPNEDGGGDSGPSPKDLLSVSLAACTSMTIELYAKRKEWKLDCAFVTVDIEKSIVGTLFKTTVELRGDLDDEQRARLFEIANKCPVHKILTGKIEVETTLA